MSPFKLTGGARIGWANATWPLATLSVTNERLDLDVSLIGNFSFTPDQIISIEAYSSFPLIGQGIKINHTVSNYKEKIIFWSFRNPEEIIREIRKTGFFDATSAAAPQEMKEQVLARQKQGGFPIKIRVAIGIVVIWNILFFIDFIPFLNNSEKGYPIGISSLLAQAFVLLICILTLISKGVRKFVLKEGRDIKDIAMFLYFLIFILGFIFAINLLTHLLQK